jgi:hypothetical protein
LDVLNDTVGFVGKIIQFLYKWVIFSRLGLLDT